MNGSKLVTPHQENVEALRKTAINYIQHAENPAILKQVIRILRQEYKRIE